MSSSATGRHSELTERVAKIMMQADRLVCRKDARLHFSQGWPQVKELSFPFLMEKPLSRINKIWFTLYIHFYPSFPLLISIHFKGYFIGELYNQLGGYASNVNSSISG